jgi:ABC-type amino acid transport substrate-binding protein
MRLVRIGLIFVLIKTTVLAAGLMLTLGPASPCCGVNEPKSVLQERNSQATPILELPITFARRTGDLDSMVKRREIRALRVPTRTGFFYDKGDPQGISFEALDEFQRFVNEKFRTGRLKINVTYIPARPEQLENALLEGVGDVIAYGVEITPEREKKVLFTTPIDSNVKQVIVTGPKAPPIGSLEDLSGKEVYVNPLAVYYEKLQSVNESFQKARKPHAFHENENGPEVRASGPPWSCS